LDGKIYWHKRRIKKLYKEALECAKAEGAKGSDQHRIARDYIEVLKINGISVAPIGSA
jgi:hypothetical protein